MTLLTLSVNAAAATTTSYTPLLSGVGDMTFGIYTHLLYVDPDPDFVYHAFISFITVKPNGRTGHGTCFNNNAGQLHAASPSSHERLGPCHAFICA